MQTWKRRLLSGMVIVLMVGMLGLLLALLFRNFIVDLWWFSELGYSKYFWYRLGYRYLVFLLFGLLFFTVFFLNFRIASRYPSGSRSAELKADTRLQRLFRNFRTGALTVYLPLSVLLALVIALPLFYRWEQVLLFLFSPPTGSSDPVYGKDISYYLFSLPIYVLLVEKLLIAAIVVLLGVALLYESERRLLAGAGQPLPRAARMHINLLIVLVFLIGAWHFILQRYLLLYQNHHTPLFYGPGFVDMQVTLPLIWICLILLAGLAAALIFLVNTGRLAGVVATAAFIMLFGIALGLRYYPGLPRLVQQYIVEPNAIARQAPYIQHNIEATLDAYNLHAVEIRDYPVQRPPWDSAAAGFQDYLHHIPVWDSRDITQVYEALQEIRTYYHFPRADVGRYIIDGRYQQVYLAPREIDTGKLPPEARTWVNRWLRYTHGYGVVMTPAAQLAAGSPRWFIQGIPPVSAPGLTIAEPGIYYGLGQYSPIIAPNQSHELSYSYNDTTVTTDYRGKGGVSLSNLFRRLVFASYFRDRNILFTTQIGADSRLLFRRNLIERIRKLTPFLTLDRDPYLVVTPEHLYWIQDAYTTSGWYPYSQPHDGKTNYLRNSVKIVVDAYDGTVDYYIADPQDPIIRTYARIYPALFKPLADLPNNLRPHLRYPRDLFQIQMAVYANYHQTDPRLFYNQEDRWVFPRLPADSGWADQTMRPHYLTLDLIERGRFEFLLMQPLVPKAQDNLRALAVAGCDGDHYGKLLIYSFPKGTLVYGPAQASALISQDPRVSEQRTLWNQQGSQAYQGRLIAVPFNGVVVYIQPIFLRRASGPQVPQLERFVVNQGQTVVMAASLEDAFRELNAKLAAAPEAASAVP